jgi:hypothetical protein
MAAMMPIIAIRARGSLSLALTRKHLGLALELARSDEVAALQ